MNLPQEAMPLPEKPMKLHENTINPPQSFDTFLTILDYTSSSGEKFRLQKVKNDPLGRDCAYLDTTTALFVEYGDKQMGKLSEKINNIKGIAIVSFIHKSTSSSISILFVKFNLKIELSNLISSSMNIDFNNKIK